jgi:HlyD family secretion protein
VLRWIVGGVVAMVIGALLVWTFLASRGEQSDERDRERAIAAPQRVTRGPAGEIIVALDPTSRARIGLQVAALAAAALQPELVATGNLQEDPSRTFTLRAPIAGILRASESSDWPRIGVALADGKVIGAIEPRVPPTTKIDLESRLASAQSELTAATATTSAARASFERNKELNAHNKIVADRVVEESEARLKESEARLAAATEHVRLVGESLKASTGPTGPMPMRLTRGGEVLEVMAQPGESIESGQAILKVGRFDALLAKVEMPAGERIDHPSSTARIVALGYEDHPLRGERIALAPSDPKTLGQTILFRVPAGGLLLRPGQPITAYLPTSAVSERGVIVPRSAIVRFAGRTWAYVEGSGDRYSRRELAVDRPAAEGWFVTRNWSPGDRVVTTGAEALLSEELRSEIRTTE